MPIEFRCNQCGKLLRTADGTAGRDAKCPSCGTVVLVPDASASAGIAPPDAERSSEGGESPFGGGGVQPADFDLDNPYVAPETSGTAASAFADIEGSTGPRTGPPWERDGASPSSFVETVKQGFGSTAFFFSDMRREGGFGSPIGFCVLGFMIGSLVNAVVQIGIQMLFIERAGGAELLIILLGMVVAFVVIMPLAAIVGAFFQSAIYHLTLYLLGGARFSFVATFRVVAYSTGVTSLVMLIPICGQYVSAIVNIVFIIIGLSKVHEISGGKASAAVLIPVAVCCGGAVLIYAAIIVATLRFMS